MAFIMKCIKCLPGLILTAVPIYLYLYWLTHTSKLYLSMARESYTLKHGMAIVKESGAREAHILTRDMVIVEEPGTKEVHTPKQDLAIAEASGTKEVHIPKQGLAVAKESLSGNIRTLTPHGTATEKSVAKKSLPSSDDWTVTMDSHTDRPNVNRMKDVPPPGGRNAAAKPQTTGTGHYLKVKYDGGMCNHVFEYASMYGIARTNNMTLVLPQDDFVRKMFRVPDTIPYDIPVGMATVMFREAKYGCYDDRTESLHARRKSVIMWKYFQSWKYFSHVSEELRQQFRFRQEDEYKLAIKEFLDKGLPSIRVDSTKGDVTYVGVHVRHGKSMTSDIAVEFGYVVAPPSYFVKAMAYYESKFRNVVFLVVSDDMKWCKENVRHPRVLYSPFIRDKVLDLALLASCNHTIMSVGTFSWWGAWLAGGDAVYYKDWPRTGSKIFADTCPQDYFLPGWVGLSG